METGGSGLSQREEDITHDSGTANAGGGDNVEDTVHIVTKIFLERGAGADMSGNTDFTNTHTQRHPCSYPVRVQVLRFFELNRVDFTGFVFCADL